jgi:hypothetical protein
LRVEDLRAGIEAVDDVVAGAACRASRRAGHAEVSSGQHITPIPYPVKE